MDTLYCEVCGHVYVGEEGDKCFWCHALMRAVDIPEEELDRMFDEFHVEEESEYIREHFVYNNPLFSEEAKLKREQDIRELEEYRAEREYQKRNAVTCPYCHSTYVQKISTLGRLFSTGLFGLGSQKLGKQWHCMNCRSDF